jgi:hypothetical protein
LRAGGYPVVVLRRSLLRHLSQGYEIAVGPYSFLR